MRFKQQQQEEYHQKAKMGTHGKRRWKISIYRSTSTPATKPEPETDPPSEFLCPISGSLMADPVIVSTGQTFERACVTACKTLGYSPTLNDGLVPDLSVIIPNLALKSSILNWARAHSSAPPRPVELAQALKLVRGLMSNSRENISGELTKAMMNSSPNILEHAESELTRRQGRFDSGESSFGNAPPLALATRPSCYSSCSSSSEFELVAGGGGGTCEYEGFVAKLRSPHVYEQEEGVAELRKVTRSCEGSRLSLSTPRILCALRPLITSKYSDIQVDALASLVNLSLEKTNKVKIVRAGFVPPIIDILRGPRFPEAQEHACGALFSLALDDDNKTAIGVLGALPPLIHFMMTSSNTSTTTTTKRACHDAALALYHLSLVQSNRSKLVKLGSVQLLLGMVKSGQMPGRALLILCNLGACNEGRAAMLDAGAVEFFVDLLRKKGDHDQQFDFDESTKESCVAAIFALSHGGLRFRGLAKAAGAVEVLRDVVEQTGRERARDKARRVLEMLKGKEEEEEDVDWEKVLEFGFPTSQSLIRPGSQSCMNSSEF